MKEKDLDQLRALAAFMAKPSRYRTVWGLSLFTLGMGLGFFVSSFLEFRLRQSLQAQWSLTFETKVRLNAELRSENQQLKREIQILKEIN